MHNSQAMTPSSRQAVGGTPTSSKPHVLAHGIPQPVPSGPSKFICVQVHCGAHCLTITTENYDDHL